MYTRTHIPNQKDNEKVLLFFRRHWITVVKIILLSLFIALIPIIFYLLFARGYAYLEIPAFRAIYFLLNSIYALFIILFAFTNFIDYYLDVWIVTNLRIINIEQKGLFAREMSEKDLGRMQDITSDVKGFLPTILNYGDVHIQTAGEEQRFVFKQIPNAEEVTRTISNIVSQYGPKTSEN